MMKWPAYAAAAFLLVAWLAPGPVAAQGIVHDPRNYAQNVLSAARALEQIRNQVRQIEQSAAMLRQSPLQMAPELARDIEDAQSLIEAGEGLAFEAEQLARDIETLYPETWAEFELAEVLDQSRQWRVQSRRALERAMAAEASALQSIGASRARIERALEASARAEGQTGAAQAGNQLLGVSAAQLAQIHALLAAQGRALETERMARLSAEERAREIRRRAFPSELSGAGAPARSAF